MKITEIPFAALRLQYRIARMPLRLFEQRVLVRVDSEAPARLLYERSVGAVDSVVGNMLGDTEVEKQGAARVERSEALGEATRLDELATQTREQADEELRRKRESAASAPGKARATSQRRVRAAAVDSRGAQAAGNSDCGQAGRRGETAGRRGGCRQSDRGRNRETRQTAEDKCGGADGYRGGRGGVG